MNYDEMDPDQQLIELRYVRDGGPRPENLGTMDPELVGWKIAHGHTLCAICAGRIMGRGCWLYYCKPAAPIYRPEQASCSLPH